METPTDAAHRRTHHPRPAHRADVAVVDTRRANARTGVPAVELTYRAYGA